MTERYLPIERIPQGVPLSKERRQVLTGLSKDAWTAINFVAKDPRITGTDIAEVGALLPIPAFELGKAADFDFERKPPEFSASNASDVLRDIYVGLSVEDENRARVGKFIYLIAPLVRQEQLQEVRKVTRRRVLGGIVMAAASGLGIISVPPALKTLTNLGVKTDLFSAQPVSTKSTAPVNTAAKSESVTETKMKPENDHLEKWKQQYLEYTQAILAQIRIHFPLTVPFMFDPEYFDKELSWMKEAMEQPYDPPYNLESQVFIPTGDYNRQKVLIITDNLGHFRAEIQANPYPAPFSPRDTKLYVHQDNDPNRPIYIKFVERTPNTSDTPGKPTSGGRSFEISFFLHRNGHIITEQAAGDQVRLRGVWTNNEIIALAEKIHPKQDRLNKKIKLVPADKNDPLPYAFVGISSQAEHIVYGANKPQPLQGYSGIDSLSTLVSSRGRVTIGSNFTYTK